MEHSATRRHSISAAVGLAVVLVVILSGCTPPQTGDEAVVTPSDPATVTSAPEPDPMVSTGPESPADVALTEQAIGTVARGSGDGAYDTLVAQLGPPTLPIEAFCNGVAQWAKWGGLTVFIDDGGALMGWLLDDEGPLPDAVRPPHDIYPGDPLQRVLDEGGVPESSSYADEPEVVEFWTELGSVGWQTVDDDPQSPIALITSNAVGCR